MGVPGLDTNRRRPAGGLLPFLQIAGQDPKKPVVTGKRAARIAPGVMEADPAAYPEARLMHGKA